MTVQVKRGEDDFEALTTENLDPEQVGDLGAFDGDSRTAAVAATATAAGNRVSRRHLRELAELKDRGILSEEQFADQKGR